MGTCLLAGAANGQPHLAEAGFLDRVTHKAPRPLFPTHICTPRSPSRREGLRRITVVLPPGQPPSRLFSNIVFLQIHR